MLKFLFRQCALYDRFFDTTLCQLQLPVAAISKVEVCGRSLAEIVGSNPTGGMDDCFVSVMY